MVRRMRAVVTGLAAVALAAPPYPPTPIGRGPRFHPPPAPEAVLRGEPVDDLRCAGPRSRFGVHVEVFARGLVVVVPSGIGVARPLVRSGAFVFPRGCTYGLRTLAPTGVVEVARGARLRLGDLFDVWGQPLSPTRLAGFRTTQARPVRAYVAGRLWRGDLRAIPLTRHAQVVLELGAYIRPHPRFLFPRGL
jgi:hypothetical protein